MAFIDWSDKDFSVGIVEIDDQHKQLVNLINELHSSMMARKAKEILGEVIDELIEYTAYHFSTEEKYFDQYGYEETDAHKKIHKDFVNEVLKFQKDVQSNKLFVSSKILNFLKNWLLNHIKVTDKKYMAFMHKHGIK